MRPARDPGEYARLLDRAGGTFSHSWAWNSWVAPLIESTFVPLVVESAGEPVGVAPMMLRRRGLVREANIVPYSFLGPVVPPELLTPTCRALRRWAVRHDVLRVRLTVHATAAPVAGSLAAAGFVEEPYRTFSIELGDGDPDAVLGSFNRDVRGALRRSVKKGVSIRTSTPDELRTLLPEVVAATVSDRLRYPRAVGRSLAAQGPDFPVHCISAVVEEEPVGIAITVGKDQPFGWLAGVRAGRENTQANTAMVWENVRWAIGTGAGTLDMLGAPSAGIAAFKQKFNPTVLTHLNGTWELPGLRVARRLAAARPLRNGAAKAAPPLRPAEDGSPDRAPDRAPARIPTGVPAGAPTMAREPAPARGSGSEA